MHIVSVVQLTCDGILESYITNSQITLFAECVTYECIFSCDFHSWSNNWKFSYKITSENSVVQFTRKINVARFARHDFQNFFKVLFKLIFFRFTMQDNLESFAYATYLKITIPFVASSPKSYVICILKIKHVWMSIVGHRSGTWKIMTIINGCF